MYQRCIKSFASVSLGDDQDRAVTSGGSRWVGRRQASGVNFDTGMVTVAGGLVEVSGELVWTEGKNKQSRRKFVVDAETARLLRAHRAAQLHERMLAGPAWNDMDLVVTSKTGTPVAPSNFDQTLDILVTRAGIARLTSHGLRHTAATHMVRQAADAGELRAVADVLGHSPDRLMKTYAHALPDSIKAVADRLAARSGSLR